MGLKKRKPSSEARVRKARAFATEATRAAALVQSDQSVNRSTRARSAYKLKADALDEVLEILQGNR